MDDETVLKKWFGFDAFRGPQAEVIAHIRQGGHALVIMPTGSGKSLCFQIPALLIVPDDLQKFTAWTDPRLVVVLSPLIALMKDQVDALIRRGIDATFINSSLDRSEREDRYRRIRDGHYRLLYVTPERFRKDAFIDAITRREITLLAVDEAHCVSEWGHDFRPDYTRLAQIRQLLGNPTTVALTATATPDCQRDIVKQLGLDPHSVRSFHTGIERPNLRLEVAEVWEDFDKLEAMEQVIGDPAGNSESGIFYFTLIKTLERFGDELSRRRIDHVRYHGDQPRNMRRRIQEQFMSGDCPLVLATNAFGMGVDKEDIRYVLHAEVPASMEAYYQEIGRAGRDGAPAVCRLLYDQRDLMTQMQFIGWRNPDADFYGRLIHYLSERNEEVVAFGTEWLNAQLQRVSRHDHRLETAFAMLDRHGVVAGPHPPACFQLCVSHDAIPKRFRDSALLADKLMRDQQRLYALVQFTQAENRLKFLNQYFGIDPD